MDNSMNSSFERHDQANEPDNAAGLASLDRRLSKARWRNLAMVMLNSLLSLLLLANISLSKLPPAVIAHQKNVDRIPTLASEEKVLTGLYEKVGAAVVKIIIVQRGQLDLSQAELQGDGTGSGIIIDRQGYVVTNQHVVDKATDVAVQLADGRLVKATLVGQDTATDLALLHIAVPETELTVARFADSELLQVGQLAVAIGYPFGLEQSLTVGHISGLDRQVPSRDKFIPLISGMIQTDAAINPGNSGGPLLNLQGEVVGINSTIYSTSRGSQGVGFALPGNMVQQVIAELLEKGYVSRPFLGVVGLGLDQARAESLGLEIDHGVLIQETYPGSPAWQAGLRPGNQRARLGRWTVLVGGDVLLAIDGQPVDSMETLSRLVQAQAIGDTISVKLYRVGQETEIMITLGERPAPVR